MSIQEPARQAELEKQFPIAIAPASTASVKRLLAAVQREDVVRGQYHDLTVDGRVRGCLFFWLYGLRSRSDREAMFRDQPEVFLATEHVIAAWDHFGMELNFVARLLENELQRREVLNAQEDAAIQAVRLRIRKRNEELDVASC